jgi:ATP-dependent helicase/nuclease subunit A
MRKSAGGSWWSHLKIQDNEKLSLAYQKLNHWINLSKFLPVHDLLDKIYHDGNLLSSYAKVANKFIRPKILANLEAFLLLALDTNAGRYPSLSRFIEELNLLSKGEEQESPDEGDIDGKLMTSRREEEGSIHSNLVRIMTIHSAKGLEAPFAILMNANQTETE